MQKDPGGKFFQSVNDALRDVPAAPECSAWLGELGSAFNECFKTTTDLQRLAFLAYTGKVEDPVRDEVLWQLSKKQQSVMGSAALWYGREYKSVDGVKGPGLTPEALACAAFQAKQMCVADVYDFSNDLLHHLNLDIRVKAPCNLRNRASSIQVGTLLVLDYGTVQRTMMPNGEKYIVQAKAQWLKKGRKDGEIDTNWQGVLLERLAGLGLEVNCQGEWDLPDLRDGNSPESDFKLHWFLVTPNPVVSVAT